MRTTKLLALTLAGVMAASLLTGCPQQQGGPDASPSSSSSSRPHHTDSSGDSSSDDTSSSEPEIEIPEGGYTIDEATGTYHVYNAEGLRAWADDSNVLSTDCTLENNIELEGEWTPIGTSEGAYKGTFDGQGHTISGLRVTGTGSAANGIFGVIAGGCVQNLRLEKPVVTRTMDYGYGIPPSANNGAIAGTLRGGQIIGCTVSNATISKSTAGGIVGSTSMNSSGSDGTTITGCAVINSQITGGTVGGIPHRHVVGQGVQLGHRRADGHAHVGAGVAVGDREHVQLVHTGTLVCDVVGAGNDCVAQSFTIDHQSFTSRL